MNFLEPKLFEDDEIQMLNPIIQNAYINMSLEQHINLNNQWANIAIPNVPGIQSVWIRRKSTGYPYYNILIKKNQNDISSVVLFNTSELSQSMQRGGKMSRRNKRSRKSRRTRNTKRRK